MPPFTKQAPAHRLSPQDICSSPANNPVCMSHQNNLTMLYDAASMHDQRLSSYQNSPSAIVPSSPPAMTLNCDLSSNESLAPCLSSHAMTRPSNNSLSFDNMSDLRQDSERLSKTSSFDSPDMEYLSHPSVSSTASGHTPTDSQANDAYPFSCLTRKTQELKSRKDVTGHVASPVDYSMPNQGFSPCSEAQISFTAATWGERCESANTNPILQTNSPSSAAARMDQQTHFNQSSCFGYAETSNGSTLPSHSVHHHVPVKKEQASLTHRQFFSQRPSEWQAQSIESLSPEPTDNRSQPDQDSDSYSMYYDSTIRRAGSDSLLEGSISSSVASGYDSVFSQTVQSGNRYINSSGRLESHSDTTRPLQRDEPTRAYAAPDALRNYESVNNHRSSSNQNNNERRYSLPVFPQGHHHRPHPYRQYEHGRAQRSQANEMQLQGNAGGNEYFPFAMTSSLSTQQQSRYSFMSQAHLPSM